ncbi:head maturation protease, ClpP-related [Pedomonas sp. V897]|uniref:head maturation protease, ClpP-related n=1 Tax=Pedomonas sp. V897 TaxID=3446482 RepID=UPI003EE26E66
MPRPAKIRLTPDQRVSAFTTEGALSRWNAGLRATADDSETSITIYDVIGEDFWTGGGVTVNRIDAALRKIGNRDVTVYINSPGGDVFEGIAIYNRLREHPAHVTVKIMGVAASAASLIAMAGDRIEIGAAAFLMIHNAWVMAIGNRHDMREVADYLEPFDAAMADVYAARSGGSRDEIVAMMDAETWLNGGQAIEKGLADALLAADEVIEGLAPEASIPAVRTVEAALCRSMPRSAARNLISQIKGKRDAAENAKHDAGDPDWASGVLALIHTLKSS